MEGLFIHLSIILVGSAVLSALAVVLKQPIIIAYIACGMLMGPWGLKWVGNVHFIETISHLGITLLLFLVGLNLHPQKLIEVFRKASIVTTVNSLVSFGVGFGVALFFKFPFLDCLCIGFAMMFSSTILVIKLMPTTALHHKHMGAVCIGVLILQDLLAVAVLALIRCFDAPSGAIPSFIFLTLKLVGFILILIVFEYYVLRHVMARVERLHEALFVLGLAWCFGVASISHNMGLFHETGAFFAGVVLARHTIARFIADELKPIRNFFLVLFFFTLGARLNPALIKDVIVIAAILAAFAILLRPWIIQGTFVLLGEKKAFSKEAGVRLGQFSEFALLIGILALEEEVITGRAAQLIQVMTILTFVLSSYYVFRRYPTPIGIPGKMKD